MTIRDLGRLAKRVKAHRLELYPSRLAAATAAGISKDTWKRVEEGKPILEVKYAQIDRALGWATGSCVTIAEGGEPVLVDQSGAGAPVPVPSNAMSAEAVRRAVLEAAAKLPPGTPIGDISAFSNELVEIFKRAGSVTEDS